MLRQFIVYTVNADSVSCAMCIEDDSEFGAFLQAMESSDEHTKVIAIKEVNIITYGYPY